MSLEEAIRLMETDSQLFYNGEPCYVLFINSLNQTCTLSDHPSEYIGKIVVQKNIKINELRRTPS